LHTYQPSPAFWYGSSNAVGATFAGEQGMHFTANGPTDFAKKNIDAYKAALARRGAPEIVKPEFPGGAAIGALRQIYVAETDAEAIAIAGPAAMKHDEEVNWLRTKNGVNELTARLNVPRAHDVAAMMEAGTMIAGSPATVLAEIRRQNEILGANYILAYMMFGDMTLEQSMRSLNLFSAEVMPAIRAM
jgi:alkanesulfonate monooxygenase SsuD/methylene tetrahydromethanopterin reductase-like flavin-dependent oxidoreductase (luciferase family)